MLKALVSDNGIGGIEAFPNQDGVEIRTVAFGRPVDLKSRRMSAEFHRYLDSHRSTRNTPLLDNRPSHQYAAKLLILLE
jgi:hypothetical protein